MFYNNFNFISNVQDNVEDQVLHLHRVILPLEVHHPPVAHHLTLEVRRHLRVSNLRKQYPKISI
jgi:hypothetical protein